MDSDSETRRWYRCFKRTTRIRNIPGRPPPRPERGRMRRGDNAYVQENVRGLDMDRSDDDPNYPTAPPRVVRYGTTVVALARRAVAETRGLMGC